MNIIDSFTNDYDNEDALYWYNERATLSTFASAISRVHKDSHVLEEYRTDKKDDEHGKWNGRADLFFVIKRTEYVAEAKQLWVSISCRAKKNVQKMKDSLKLARKEVVSSTDIVKYKLGIIFVVPLLPISELDSLEERKEEFIRQVNEVDYGAMAYTFPSDCLAKGKKYFYPGVACCIRVPKRK